MLSIVLTTLLAFTAMAGTEAKYLAFYGTNQADWALVDPQGTGLPITWKILRNPSSPVPGSAQISIFDWGITGDGISPGSYSGDNFFDPNVSRAGVNWMYPYPSNPGGVATPWGTGTDNFGRNGDYDGDGIEDYAVIRISANILNWWIRPSSAPGTTRVVTFGQLATGTSLFAFEGADFTGDGRDEIVIARVTNASGTTVWWIGDAVTGQLVMQVLWGNFNTHFIINPADYTGDGKADFVTWSAGNAIGTQKWWIMNSATGQLVTEKNIPFGVGDPAFINMDLPVRGDYDGDNIDDIAVWRPGTATFYVLRTTDGALVQQQWGNPASATEFPVGNLFTF